MSTSLNVLLLVASKAGPTCRRYQELLRGTAAPSRPVRVQVVSSLEKACERLKEHLKGRGRRGAVVVSDLLCEDLGVYEASSAARGLIEELGEYPYATIALLNPAGRPGPVERPADIDQAVSTDAGPAELQAAVQSCLDKLDYLSRPPKRREPLRPVVRAITSRSQLFDYFRLRHEAYTPMSYLSPLVQRVKSRMDIDWFDTRAVHVGAFEQRPGAEELIGTARLITTEPLRPEHAEWTLELAGQDTELHQYVTEGAVQALLPVFQSHNLETHLHQASREGYLIGELSRVIVHLDYRGAGLSHLLIDHALALAEKEGVRELFLECLPVHEELYQRHGFRKMPQRGKVYMVNKTMSVMYRPLSEAVIPVGIPA